MSAQEYKCLLKEVTARGVITPRNAVLIGGAAKSGSIEKGAEIIFVHHMTSEAKLAAMAANQSSPACSSDCLLCSQKPCPINPKVLHTIINRLRFLNPAGRLRLLRWVKMVYGLTPSQLWAAMRALSRRRTFFMPTSLSKGYQMMLSPSARIASKRMFATAYASPPSPTIERRSFPRIIAIGPNPERRSNFCPLTLLAKLWRIISEPPAFPSQAMAMARVRKAPIMAHRHTTSHMFAGLPMYHA